MEQILEYIDAIMRSGSFRLAAEELHITQPALSIALKKYEDELNTILFDRKKRPIVPTPSGEIVLRHIAEIRAAEKAMYTELLDCTDAQTGELSIGATHFFNTHILPPILRRFMDQHPGIRVHITEESSHEIVRDYNRNLFDIIFFAGNLALDHLHMIPVLHDQLLFVIPDRFMEENPLKEFGLRSEQVRVPPAGSALRALPSLDLFRTVPFIALSSGDLLYEQTMQLFRSEGVRPNICLNMQQMATSYRLACAGIGATITSDALIKTSPPSGGGISFYRFDSPLMRRTIYAGYDKNRYVTHAMRIFLDLCRFDPKAPGS